MATPIGHSLAGYAIYSFSARAKEASRLPLILLCVMMSNAPDLDFLPGLVMGRPALYHQGITHSLGFALTLSLILAMIYHMKGWSFCAIFKLSFFSYVSHLAIDFFGPDGRPPYGMPLFWPLSMEYFISPVPLLWGVHHAPSTAASILEWFDGIFDLYNVGAISLEVFLITPFIFLGRLYSLRRPRQVGT